MFPTPRSGPCDLPTTHDLIIWQRAPRLHDSAFEVGDADLCIANARSIRGAPHSPLAQDTVPRSTGSDNPNYDVDARPAPPLKKVIDEVGDC